jgi:hypothetical protein
MALGEYLNLTGILNTFCKKGTLAFSRWKIDREVHGNCAKLLLAAALFLVFACDRTKPQDSGEVHVMLLLLCMCCRLY